MRIEQNEQVSCSGSGIHAYDNSFMAINVAEERIIFVLT